MFDIDVDVAYIYYGIIFIINDNLSQPIDEIAAIFNIL